ncbi:hypothetical protein TGPRC2_318300 [Toxoplasma gondii TgCatPRC2]|uniref:Uncharacterized protein n=6 Tax=Toxoplasma gondii TaxID=5811 RepID=S7VZ26_TOXGG|nr:hypothetical protein TGME49_318300 [Toxoplasma gondii ME49]EPR58243.1 hypothetical protein TGGT1_318300 [Toxoplasma gondii GT1]KAF4645009.1 hypothetical protein TGRH88_008250 [Toxoplasma gondii]KYF39496.1 hypothetical protein TGARI_318300 [Toxoplasma gondii ARI]KYK66962.1 hypothetical protein TGPRC2_318300 [Toxoplasma gondii TgCatPRC2]EPT31441.1 hypothetical protein TGME49_318300 [Toxoplasma gondii ME49]|eukprot:XP_002369769.1 hypothetical protein TGME49_318300 [Toxoplasma gondii ME49]
MSEPPASLHRKISSTQSPPASTLILLLLPRFLSPCARRAASTPQDDASESPKASTAHDIFSRLYAVDRQSHRQQIFAPSTFPETRVSCLPRVLTLRLESFAFGDEERDTQTGRLSPESAVLFCRNLRAKEIENDGSASLPYEHAFCVTFARPSEAQVCFEALSAEQELHREEFRTTFLIAAQAETAENSRAANAEELRDLTRWKLWTSTRKSDFSALAPRIAVVLQSADRSLLHKKTSFFRNALDLVSRLIATFDDQAPAL